jgi:DNA-binding PadR family transcriptional regulator
MSVRHALLALLSEGPKYGLQLRQEFESRTGEVWPLNVGQVYTTLQRLERDGLVASEGSDDGPQKGYRLTEDGGRELMAWLQTPPDDVQPPRDELLIKILVAVQVPGVAVGDVIQVHRRHLVELMQRYTALKADAAEDDVALALVVDAELFRIEGAVRWLDSAETRLRNQVLRAPASPPPHVAPTGRLLAATRPPDAHQPDTHQPDARRQEARP